MGRPGLSPPPCLAAVFPPSSIRLRHSQCPENPALSPHLNSTLPGGHPCKLPSPTLFSPPLEHLQGGEGLSHLWVHMEPSQQLFTQLLLTSVVRRRVRATVAAPGVSPQAPCATCFPNVPPPTCTTFLLQDSKLVFRFLNVSSSRERRALTKVFLKGKFTEQLNGHFQRQGEAPAGWGSPGVDRLALGCGDHHRALERVTRSSEGPTCLAASSIQHQCAWMHHGQSPPCLGVCASEGVQLGQD